MIKSFSVMLANIHVPLITAEDTWGLISQAPPNAALRLNRKGISLCKVTPVTLHGVVSQESRLGLVSKFTPHSDLGVGT